MHGIASKSGTRARLLWNESLARRRRSPFPPPSCRRTSSGLELEQTHRHHLSRSRPNRFDAASVSPFASPPALPTGPTRRLVWSSSDAERVVREAEAEAETAVAEAPPSPPLPVPPVTPSSASATSIIEHSTIESLKSLPECQMVLNLLNGSSDGDDGSGTIAIEPTRLKEAHSNLDRARDILQSLPELRLATHLLEADLFSFCGKFNSALEALARYEHLKDNATKIDKNERRKLQFLRAKLLVHSGRFAHALSEYEDLLEGMEREVERQMKRMEREEEKNRGGGDRLPVIHGAAALTGVGVTKLLLHLRGGGGDADRYEIVEGMETVAEMLLESRGEALLSAKHFGLAVDLGLAASISYTNLGVAHCLLSNDRELSMTCWKRGLKTLDAILQDAMNSATIIPSWTIQCMEGVRARLHCNMAWSSLGLDSPNSSEGGGTSNEASDETLKEASDSAKRALDIYDELLNGSKLMREYNATGGADGGDDASAASDGAAPREPPLSPLWAARHRAESARALGLVARCYAAAGAAVTAEGLFQSALDASSSYSLGRSLKSGSIAGKGVSSSSPHLGLIARDVRLRYATLCDGWEKRRGDADRLRADARRVEEEGVLRGYARGEDGEVASVSGLEASLWLFGPSDFER